MSNMPPKEAPQCVACKTELPLGARVCTACNTLQTATVDCPTCHALIPEDARKCTFCDSFFDYRQWVVIAPVVIGIVSLLSFGVPLAIRAIQRDSFTEARIVGAGLKRAEGSTSGGEVTLLVGVANSGYASSVVRREFTLEFENETDRKLIQFGALTLTQQDRSRLLAPSTSSFLELEIDSIKPACDVTTQAFWQECGAVRVKLKGKAEESDGNIRDLEHAVPLSEIKDFVIGRKDPGLPGGTCQCAH